MTFTEIIGKLFSWIPGIGNAALRDRVLLAQEESVAFRRKAEASALRAVNLESEVKTLRFELQKCGAKVHALEKSLSELQQKQKTKNREEPEHKMLAFIGSRDGVTQEQIAGHCGISAGKVRHHLALMSDLTTRKMVLSDETPEEWILRTAGRVYLDERGLL